jgi:hypothetical protein
MTRLERFVLSLTVAAAFVLLSAGAAAPRGRDVSLSLPTLQIGAGERVVGFRIQVTSGRIVRLPDVPIGWSVTVENDPSWNTKFEGAVIVATAAVDASFFKDFAVLEKDEKSEDELEVNGEIDVSQDFSAYRKIQVKMKDFRLKQSAARER